MRFYVITDDHAALASVGMDRKEKKSHGQFQMPNRMGGYMLRAQLPRSVKKTVSIFFYVFNHRGRFVRGLLGEVNMVLNGNREFH